MTFDFLLNEKTNDIVFENGDFVWTKDNTELLRQRISITLQTWQGEWFWDTSFGTPYKQSILGKNRDKKEVDAIFIGIINSFDDVESLEEFESTYNIGDIRYELSFRVKAVDGDTVVITNVRPDQEEIYPEPIFEEPNTPICEAPTNYILSSGNWLAASGNDLAVLGNYFEDQDHPDGSPIVPYAYEGEAGEPEAEAGNDIEAGDSGNIPL